MRFLEKLILLLVAGASIAQPQVCTSVSDNLYSTLSYSGTASVSGTTLTILTGQPFTSLAVTEPIALGATSYIIQSIINASTLVLVTAPIAGTYTWTYNVPLPAGSQITIRLGYSPLPTVQSTAVLTIGATNPNIITCLVPATYTASYVVYLLPLGTGTTTYNRFWNVPGGGPYTVTSYPSAPGVETVILPNPYFTISLQQLAPSGGSGTLCLQSVSGLIQWSFCSGPYYTSWSSLPPTMTWVSLPTAWTALFH